MTNTGEQIEDRDATTLDRQPGDDTDYDDVTGDVEVEATEAEAVREYVAVLLTERVLDRTGDFERSIAFAEAAWASITGLQPWNPTRCLTEAIAIIGRLEAVAVHSGVDSRLIADAIYDRGIDVHGVPKPSADDLTTWGAPPIVADPPPAVRATIDAPTAIAIRPDPRLLEAVNYRIADVERDLLNIAGNFTPLVGVDRPDHKPPMTGQDAFDALRTAIAAAEAAGTPRPFDTWVGSLLTAAATPCETLAPSRERSVVSLIAANLSAAFTEAAAVAAVVVTPDAESSAPARAELAMPPVPTPPPPPF